MMGVLIEQKNHQKPTLVDKRVDTLGEKTNEGFFPPTRCDVHRGGGQQATRCFSDSMHDPSINPPILTGLAVVGLRKFEEPACSP